LLGKLRNDQRIYLQYLPFACFLAGTAYFEALTEFGVECIVSMLNKKQQPCTIFLQTHLIGCAKESHLPLFRQLIQSLYEKPDDQLGDIIHYRSENKDSVFCDTALNWAVKNNHMLIVLELLKLEHHFHKTEEEGLKCLQDTVSTSTDKLQWIFEKYKRISQFDFSGALLGEHFCYSISAG
jgi:hypothetical protein